MYLSCLCSTQLWRWLKPSRYPFCTCWQGRASLATHATHATHLNSTPSLGGGGGAAVGVSEAVPVPRMKMKTTTTRRYQLMHASLLLCVTPSFWHHVPPLPPWPFSFAGLSPWPREAPRLFNLFHAFTQVNETK